MALARRAWLLVAAIEQVPGTDLSEGHAAGWAADCARLCADAPAPLRTLTLICAREQATADGHPDHVPLQPWVHRALASFVS